MKIVVGTRGSKLAVWQATWVKERLTALGHSAEVKLIKTTGDKLATASLARSGTKGLFIKEIEEELAEGLIDLAVHSLKDLPTDQPDGLTVAAVPEREDARDVFVSRNGQPFGSLPAGSRVATSSLRRECQLRALRPDLEVVPIRGNLDTRLKKLDRGEFDALVLAAAGLRRLGLSGRVTSIFSIEEMCPAVGQGALAIEIRCGDARIERVVGPLDHEATHIAVRAERATLRHLGGGCQAPIAAHAVAEADELRMVGLVASQDGAEVIRAQARGPRGEPESLGATVARELSARGARAILESLHAQKTPR